MQSESIFIAKSELICKTQIRGSFVQLNQRFFRTAKSRLFCRKFTAKSEVTVCDQRLFCRKFTAKSEVNVCDQRLF